MPQRSCTRGKPVIAGLRDDFRYALRTTAMRPLLALVAVLSLALGIGVNTAIYSLFHHVVLRPLAVAEPSSLVNLATSGGLRRGSTSNNQAGPREAIFSYPMFRDLQASAEAGQVLRGLAAHRSFPTNIATGEASIGGTGLLVSGNYFDVLGLQPALGRLLQPQDDAAIGTGRVAVLTHAYWRNAFGGDPGVLGRELLVNGESLRIVGVAPAGFEGTTLGVVPQVFVPITLRWLLQPTMRKDSEDRRSYWVYLFGRLAPGVDAEQAQVALDRPYAALLDAIELPLQGGLDADQRRQFLAGHLVLDSGERGQSSVPRQARTPLVLLLALAALVLLVACLNIANLLLARGAARAGELAVRSAIGASRARLLRQLLAESVLLAVCGAALSLPLAVLALRGLLAFLPGAETIVGAGAVTLQPAALRFAVATGAFTVLLFGLFPALGAAGASPIAALRGEAAQTTGGAASRRFRNGLATAQIGLSMLALALAGLFAQSLSNLARVDLGMRVESVAGFNVSPARSGYTPARSALLFDRIEEELAGLPGVDAVALSLVPLFTGSEDSTSVSVEGFESTAEMPSSYYNYVGEDFFSGLRIPVLAGRTFTRADNAGAARVAVVSRRFADAFGLGPDPLGKRMAIGSGDVALDIEIVGLVGDSKYEGVKAAEPVQFYLPRRQDPRLGDMTFYVRASGDPQALLAMLRASVARIAPDVPIENLRTLPQTIALDLATDRFVGTLSAAFAVLATALAALGLYGVLCCTLVRRTRELGLRLALGAPPRRLVGMLLAQVGRMTVLGIVLGLLAALALGRAAQSLLFGLQAHDPWILLAGVGVLGVVAIASAIGPARRAARLDPMEALRHE